MTWEHLLGSSWGSLKTLASWSTAPFSIPMNGENSTDPHTLAISNHKSQKRITFFTVIRIQGWVDLRIDYKYRSKNQKNGWTEEKEDVRSSSRSSSFFTSGCAIALICSDLFSSLQEEYCWDSRRELRWWKESNDLLHPHYTWFPMYKLPDLPPRHISCIWRS